MKENQKFRKTVPYLLAIVIFAALSALYFSPQFSGKEIYMHDVVQYKGMSKEIVDHIDTYDEDPQWTGSLFGGMPAQLIHMHYDSMIVKWVMSGLDFLGRPASMIFVAMLSFFVMLLMFRVNPWVAIVPALAYGFSTYSFLIIEAGHITKMIAFGYAPMMIGGVYYTLRRNMWIGAVLTALFAALQLAGNHPQISYYFLFVLVALWINEGVRAFKEKTLPHFAKATGLLALAAVLAVGANLAPLHYINEYGKDSMRGGSELVEEEGKVKDDGLALEYATQWSYGKLESFNLLVPNFMGGATTGAFSDDGEVAQLFAQSGQQFDSSRFPSYWGNQPMTGGPTYIGAVVIFLFVLGLFLLKGRTKWWVLAVSVVVLMLAWGSNFIWFTELFFNYLPGYNKFRTVAMILVVVQWSVPFLAALILNKIYRSELSRAEIVKGVRNSLMLVGGVLLFFVLFGGSLFSFNSPYDTQMPPELASAARMDRAALLRSDSLRSLIFVLLTASVVLLYAFDKLKRWLFVGALSGLVLFDLVPINMRYLPKSKFIDSAVNKLVPSEADKEIMRDTTQGFRVMYYSSGAFNDATTSYFHRSVGGYHGAKMQRYQDIIDRYLSRGDQEVLNMLNTKYFIEPTNKGPRVVMRQPNGAAWFVDSVEWAESATEEIEALSYIDTKSKAVVDRRFEQQLDGVEFGRDSTARIELTEYRANYLKYRTTAEKERVAIFSEIYYDKGWRAFVDGEEVPHFRADYILRGAVVPAGEHVVEFRYRAAGFKTYSGLTLASSILIYLGVIGAGVYYFVARKRNLKIDGTGEQEA